MGIAAGRISTVTASSASYALVDLATAKNELNIRANDTTNDTALTRTINFISQIIANYCGGPFGPFAVEAVTDTFQFDRDAFPGIRFAGENRIALARCPLLSIGAVVQTNTDGSTTTLVQGTDYLLHAKQGELMRLSCTGALMRWETLPLSVSYVAGYGALITAEAQTVPGSAPYTVNATNAATFAFDQGVTYANGTPLTLVAANPAHGQYSVANGVYTFAAADAHAAVLLAYAYNQIPYDLVSHALEIVTARWASRGRDPALVQVDTPGIGTQRFWFGSEPGQDGELPPRIAAALDNTYRPPRVA